MDFVEEQAMKIITNSGMAKSYALEAVGFAKEGNFEEAAKTVELAEESLGAAGKAHHDTLVESAKDDFKVTLLLAHAEDQMLTSEIAIALCKELIDLHEIKANK